MVREVIHDFAHGQGIALAFSLKSQWKTLIFLVKSGKKIFCQCCEPWYDGVIGWYQEDYPYLGELT